jgi:hypothetical protein
MMQDDFSSAVKMFVKMSKMLNEKLKPYEGLPNIKSVRDSMEEELTNIVDEIVCHACGREACGTCGYCCNPSCENCCCPDVEKEML